MLKSPVESIQLVESGVSFTDLCISDACQLSLPTIVTYYLASGRILVIGYPSPRPRKDACCVIVRPLPSFSSNLDLVVCIKATQPRIPRTEFGKFGVFYNILSLEYMSDQLGCKSGSALGTSG